MARILVIDDDQDLLQMMGMMLKRGDHEVIVAADGPTGIAKAQQECPDMAIVDVMMPGMTGYQVVRRLREDPATADMVILILTARAQSVDREAAMAAKADDYMAKPVAPVELLEKVDELLSKRLEGALPDHFVLTVFSLRGGAGATTLAVNLGLVFQAAGVRTCVVDLCTRSGHVALQLLLQAKVSWADLLPKVGMLGPETIEKALLRHESGLYVLPSPLLPPAQPVNEGALTELLGLLKSFADALVIDASGGLDISTRAALGLSDHVLVVTTPEVASLQTTGASLRLLNALGVPTEKISLVSNQVMPRPGLSVSAIGKALSRPIKLAVPYDEAQVHVLGRGAPLVRSSPESPLSAAVRQAMDLFVQERE